MLDHSEIDKKTWQHCVTFPPPPLPRYESDYVPLIPEPIEDVSYKTKYTDIDRKPEVEVESGVLSADIGSILEAAKKTLEEVKVEEEEEEEEDDLAPIRIEVEQVRMSLLASIPFL